MSKPASKRLMNELTEIRKNPPENCTAEPLEDDLYKWRATMFGPTGTPYENGVFELDIFIPHDYPFKPPKISFKTPILHPNISKGNICLDILKSSWSPALTITKVLLSISSLLSEPNPDSALDSEISSLYRKNREEYNRRIREHTRLNTL